MEVLISIGVIALGIFGVSSLIPLAQFQVAKGTAKARQAALGQRAIAEFRIRDMGSPGVATAPKWRTKSGLAQLYNPQTRQLRRRGFCIDPLGIAGTSNDFQNFPVNGTAGLVMPRVTLTNLFSPNVPADLAVSLARDVCFLEDDLVFDRPDEQAMQPNRQFFVEAIGRDFVPIRSFASGSMSWFATLSPSFASTSLDSTPDEFLLSVVVVQNRVVKRPPFVSPGDQITEENFALVEPVYAGGVRLVSVSTSEAQFGVEDLVVGDWILLVRPRIDQADFDDSSSLDKVYRWAQITAATEAATGGNRFFNISNDDFLRSGVSGSGGLPARAILVRGVKAVYEKTIRIENSSSWN